MKNKIFIFLAYRNSTQQFVELVKKLKNKYKVYCLVFGFQNYLFVNKNKYLFEEIYSYEILVDKFYKNVKKISEKEIHDLESKIGCLWNIIYADRQLIDYYYDENYGNKKYNYEELVSFSYQWFKLFDELFKKEEFKYLINYATASMPALVSVKIAKKYNAEYFLIRTLAVPDRFSLVDDIDQKYLLNTDNNFDQDIEWSRDFIKNFHKEEAPYWVRKKSKEFFLKRYFKHFKNIFLENKSFPFLDRNNPAYLSISLKNIIIEKIKKLYWGYFEKKYCVHNLDKIDKKYIYFSFHKEPEANLMIQNLQNTNQINILENLSKYCPGNLIIVAKCHPNQNHKPPEFFKRINKLPNVILLNKKIDSKNIIKNSHAIFCLSGTLIFEALLRRKKILVYGNNRIVKNFFPKLKCNFEEIKDRINDGYIPSEDEVIKMIATLKNISVEFTQGDFVNSISPTITDKMLELINRLEKQKLNKI